MADAQPLTRYVRDTAGRHSSQRRLVNWVTQSLYFGLPWLSWQGQPVLLLDLPARRIHLFGQVLWPHDAIYLAGLLLVTFAALLLACTRYGRLACGYACPHTVYTDLFMGIERRIEGSVSARRRRDSAPLTACTLAIKAAKHGAWALLAGWIGLTLVAYFTPVRTLLPALAHGALGPWQASIMGAYGLLAYVNAGWMRAQVCAHACPLGRLQGTLAGPDTLVVSYDAARGEPRGLRNRKALAAGLPLGDCRDCTLCVQVCPTGSDIRNGFAHDCIGCGSCIDACNQVMRQVGAPPGLVRYASLRQLAGPAAPPAPRWRSPPWLLAGLMAVLWLALAVALATRVPLAVGVERERALAWRQADDGSTENVYRLHVLNTDRRPHRYRISVAGAAGLQALPALLELDAGTSRRLPLRVWGMASGRQRITVRVEAEGDSRLAQAADAVFVAP